MDGKQSGTSDLVTNVSHTNHMARTEPASANRRRHGTVTMPTSVVTSSTRLADCLNVTWGTRGAGRGCQPRTMPRTRTELEAATAPVSLAGPDRRHAQHREAYAEER